MSSCHLNLSVRDRWPTLGVVSLKQKKVQGQWLLYCLVHNIEKLKDYGQWGNRAAEWPVSITSESAQRVGVSEAVGKKTVKLQ